MKASDLFLRGGEPVEAADALRQVGEEQAAAQILGDYHRDRGDDRRDVCIIPQSAHGTNPASAIAAGYRVVPVRCDERGNVDVDDLRAKAAANADALGAFAAGENVITARIENTGGASYFDIADAVVYGSDNGANILNMSLGGPFSTTMQNAVNYGYAAGVDYFPEGM